jgi:rhamnogalacturonyl hydrolase YesR
LRREEGYSMKSATIFIAFGLLAGIIQRVINTLAGLETSKGLKGILYNFPAYALGGCSRTTALPQESCGKKQACVETISSGRRARETAGQTLGCQVKRWSSRRNNKNRLSTRSQNDPLAARRVISTSS